MKNKWIKKKKEECHSSQLRWSLHYVMLQKVSFSRDIVVVSILTLKIRIKRENIVILNITMFSEQCSMFIAHIAYKVQSVQIFPFVFRCFLPSLLILDKSERKLKLKARSLKHTLFDRSEVHLKWIIIIRATKYSY